MIVALVVGFVLAFIGSIPIAGPIAVAVLSMALDHRSRSALFIATGAAFAEAIYAFLAFWGFSAALERFPSLLPATHLFGCGLLIALGIYLAVRRPASKATAQSKEQSRALGPRTLLLGFSLTLVNPTLIVTWTAAVSAVHSSDLLRLDARDAFPFALGVCGGIIAWFSVMLALIAKFRERFAPGRRNTVVRATGIGLATLGAVFVVRTLTHWR